MKSPIEKASGASKKEKGAVVLLDQYGNKMGEEKTSELADQYELPLEKSQSETATPPSPDGDPKIRKETKQAVKEKKENITLQEKLVLALQKLKEIIKSLPEGN